MPKAHALHHLTPEDYLAGERLSAVRHEFIDGQIYAMAGAGERHNRIALNAALQLPTGRSRRPLRRFHERYDTLYRRKQLLLLPGRYAHLRPGRQSGVLQATPLSAN